MEMEEPMKQEIVGGIDGEKQLFCVTLGRTLAPFSFLPFVALVAFGVFTFLTLLAFLALLALLAFARNIGVEGTRAFAFPFDRDVQGVPQLACVKDHYRQ